MNIKVKKEYNINFNKKFLRFFKKKTEIKITPIISNAEDVNDADKKYITERIKIFFGI